jgi:hypothetical protein
MQAAYRDDGQHYQKGRLNYAARPSAFSPIQCKNPTTPTGSRGYKGRLRLAMGTNQKGFRRGFLKLNDAESMHFLYRLGHSPTDSEPMASRNRGWHNRGRLSIAAPSIMAAGSGRSERSDIAPRSSLPLPRGLLHHYCGSFNFGERRPKLK